MNSSLVDRPPFACRLARGTIALLGDTSTGVPRGPGSGHVAGCEDCQMHFAACDDFDLALKRDALAVAQAPSGGLEQRIIRAVHQAARAEERGSAPYFSFGLAGAAACSAAAILIFQQPPTPSPVAPTERTLAITSGDRTGAAVSPAMASLLETDPLQSEVDAVISDAQSAVQFLARNFLPASVPSGSGRNG